MQFLETQHKRKSAVITAVILMLLIFGIFNFGMKYLDPPIEYGLAINFGNSEVGSGEPVEKTKSQSAPVEKQEEVVEEQVKEVLEETIQEDIITDDSADDVPVIEKTIEKKEVVRETPKEVKPKKKPKPKPSKETTDALNSLLNGTSKDGAAKGEGDDTQSGVKGNGKGDPNSNKYYGNSGSGSGGNYNLAGRKALSKPIEKPNCEEEGTVVVSIEVDQNGKVIKVKAGARGTTNSAPCLYKAAEKAALRTRWNAAVDAPSKQRGTIIYKFSLLQ
jgi:outer membrane biosynthesis protein TonB